MKRLLVSAMAMAAAACVHAPASPAEPRNPRRPAAEVADQRRSSYIGVSGLVKADTVRRQRNAETFSFALYSRVPRTGAPVAHVLVVNHRYWGDWVFWTSARLDNRNLRFATLDLRVLECTPKSGCGRDEGFMLGISDASLRAHRGGFDVRLFSRARRERALRVTPGMIAEQLRVVDSVRAARAR